MSFNSFSFILIFLPLVLIVWHGLNKLKSRKLADLSLIAASLILYGLFSIDFVIVLLLSAFVTFYFGNLITRAGIKLKKE